MTQQITRNCPYCKVPMESETRAIPKTVKKVIKIDVEDFLPEPVKKYSQYTACVCPNCGKLEMYLS